MACTAAPLKLTSGVVFPNRRPLTQRRPSRQLLKRAAAVEYPEALLFDCDGVLVDTERDGHRVAFNAAFDRSGVNHEWGVELYGKLLETGGGKERMIVYFSGCAEQEPFKTMTDPEEQKEFVKGLHLLKTDIFMEMVESGAMPLRPGVRRLTDEAMQAGVPIAVCSTSNERAVSKIVEVMLGPAVAEKMRVFAGDVVPKKKPAPDIYNLAAAELNVDPTKYAEPRPPLAASTWGRRCVVIEDSAIGLQAAKSAGMRCVVTRSSYTQNEDFNQADGIYDCIGEQGEERFSLKDLCFETSTAA